jgi:multicomponent Na+:H+ antiporter subunit F
MLNNTSEIGLAMLALGAVFTFIRLVRGPSLPDRVISIDLIGIIIVCVLVVVAGDSGQQAFLDVAIVIALISFVGTVAYARYLERQKDHD